MSARTWPLHWKNGFADSRMTWRVLGEVLPPGDKSISHRALILSAISDGRSRVVGILDAADTRSTATVLRQLGCTVPEFGTEIVVSGVGRRGFSAPASDLYCGNSGTTARLVAGAVAGMPVEARFTGDGSLSRRPMRRIAEPLRAMGAYVEFDGGDVLPMRVRGGELAPIRWRCDTPSAQVKSAILLAAVVAGVEAEVEEPAVTRDHTERMLRAAGAAIDFGSESGAHSSEGGARVALRQDASLVGRDWVVPGDPSSAAYICALAAIADAGEVLVRDVCANPTRIGFADILRRMGARLSLVDSRTDGVEPLASIRSQPGALRAVALGPDDVTAAIDEIPLVACVAALADGTTTIHGAAELRVKESDRISAVVANLRAVGATAEETEDGLCVEGSRRPLRGRVETRGDHRIAMAFGVLAARPGNEIEIDDRDCVAVSYPRFWEDIDRLTGG